MKEMRNCLKADFMAAALTVIAALLLPESVLAQLKENVAVQGEYRPVIVDVDRINVYPASSKSDLTPVEMQYESEGIVTDFPPTLLPMGVTGWRTGFIPRKYRGYIAPGLGSRLNSNLSAGYSVPLDSLNLLDMALQFNSTSLYRAKGNSPGYTEPSKRELYDGNLMVNYTGNIKNRGILNASLKYSLAYFNYYGSVIPAALNVADMKAPTQTLNRFNAGVTYRSSQTSRSDWRAGVFMNYMAYRQYILPDYWLGESLKGERETDLNFFGGIDFGLKPNSSVSIDASGHFLFYSALRNYGLITLAPAYNLTKEGIRLKIGVRGDFSYDIMGASEGKKYGLFHIAPDISFSYRTGFVGLSASFTGGTELQTLAQRESYDFYQIPVLLTSLPVYKPLEAKAGVSFGPFSGFSAGMDFRYVIARNTPLGGWYQVMLGSMFDTSALSAYGRPQYSFSQSGVNLKGYDVGLNIGYSYGSLLTLSFNGLYSPQNGKTGIFNGYDRSRWQLQAEARVSPLRRLDVEVGYGYRGVRTIYSYVDAVAYNGDDVRILRGVRLPDVTDLHAGISYRFADNLTVSCRADNLLNRRIDILPGLQSEGLTVMGNIDFRF